MDFATLIGLVVGTAVIIMAILSGADATIFINVPGMLIVMGGTFASTLIKFPVRDFFQSIGLAIKKAFWQEIEDPLAIIQLTNELSGVARKQTLVALEDIEVKNPFFKKGIQLSVDGRKPEYIRDVLSKEMSLSIERHEISEKVFRAMGDAAPAFGMIGTLVGLVQMLANMQDPKSIGPSMAVALLTTLYGAMFANLIAIPIADKLKNRTEHEYINKSLILESVLGILQGVHPRVLNELLESYLPSSHRNIINASNTSTDENKDDETKDETP